jgi:hypothetical protein
MEENPEDLANALTKRAHAMILQARMRFMASCKAENINIVAAMYAWDMGTLAVGLDCTNKTYIILGNMLAGVPIEDTLMSFMGEADREKAAKDFQEQMWLWKMDQQMKSDKEDHS